ncbi:hypothetical protein [Haloprofundus halophilus]|uniref:hypothetical protein n=1 Tax=Haloprofundus halophilus TaxID=2283527 RepID=UPI0018E573D0|nr:hypothetical protein [Haloprofundus halophilus]
MSQQLQPNWFVRSTRANAILAWLLVGLLAVTVVGSVLQNLFAQAAIAGVAVAVAVVPALVDRSWTHAMPWPLVFLASLPQALGLFGLDFVADVLVGVGLATLALLGVVALQMTTTLRMTPSFAVVFVTIATLAVTGLWAVGSAASASVFGTAFVDSNDQLMTVFTAAALGGAGTGLAFRRTFRRRLGRDQTDAAETAVADAGGEFA